MPLPRLRQVVLAARQLDPVAAALETALGLREPFVDDGVGHFGLRNAVYALGDTFIEIVSPQRPDTSAGRYLDRCGGDCGYMVMFEVADADATRERLADVGVRVVWEGVRDDITDLHLHPKDVGGAIVALDVTIPPGSWRWAGPAWVGQVPPFGPGGVRGMTLAARDPAATAARWAEVLGVTTETPTTIALDSGAQLLRFEPATPAGREGVVAVDVTTETADGDCDIAGVRFHRQQPQDTRGHRL